MTQSRNNWLVVLIRITNFIGRFYFLTAYACHGIITVLLESVQQVLPLPILVIPPPRYKMFIPQKVFSTLVIFNVKNKWEKGGYKKVKT